MSDKPAAKRRPTLAQEETLVVALADAFAGRWFDEDNLSFEAPHNAALMAALAPFKLRLVRHPIGHGLKMLSDRSTLRVREWLEETVACGARRYWGLLLIERDERGW